MAKLEGFDTTEFDKWLETRPQVIKDLAKRFPPNVLYRMKNTGHRVFVRGYNEDGTLIVYVGSEFNRITFARNVFNVSPEDLEECDFPPDDEPVGALLIDESQIEEYLHLLRKRRKMKAFECTMTFLKTDNDNPLQRFECVNVVVHEKNPLAAHVQALIEAKQMGYSLDETAYNISIKIIQC